MKNGFSMKVLLVVFAMMLAVTPGCYGPFTLTKSLHEWNDDVGDGNKWVSELVFLGLIILPVYGIATLGDAIIFNSIEFWTGDNPLDGDAKVIDEGDTRIVMERVGDVSERRVVVQVFEADRLVEEATLVTTEDGRTLKYDANGVFVSTAEVSGDGELVIVDADGEERIVTRESIDRALER